MLGLVLVLWSFLLLTFLGLVIGSLYVDGFGKACGYVFGSGGVDIEQSVELVFNLSDVARAWVLL